MHVKRAPHSASDSSKFLFIPVDGLDSLNRQDTKPESQKYLTAARKHVMHDIGLSRRRGKRKRPLIAHSELPPRLQATDSVTHDVTKLPQEPESGCNDALIIQDVCASVLGEQANCQTSAFTTLHANFVNCANTILNKDVYQLQQPLGSSRLDPFVQWPVSLTYRMQYLLDHLLSTDCKSIRPFRSATQYLLNLDPGIFYHSLAISAFCLSARVSPSKKHVLISEGLFYYDKGLKSVTSRLGDRLQRQSDGVIASIMGIAIHSLTGSTTQGWCWETAHPSLKKCEDAADQWLLHFQALKTILDHRGSAESINLDPLRHWLYLMDVEGTVTRDIEPFFQLPPYILPSAQALPLTQTSTIAACLSSWTHEFPAQRAIIHILIDLDYTISWLSEQLALQDGAIWSNLKVDTLWLIPLVHRCLQLSGRRASELVCDNVSTSDSHDEAFQDALRHTIILFLAPIRRRFGLPALGTDLHITKLISALNLCLNHRATLNLQTFMFWMFVVGALEACSLGRDASWFFSHIIDCCLIIGARQFREVSTTVKYAMTQVIWLEEVMSPAFALMMVSLREYMEAQSTDER